MNREKAKNITEKLLASDIGREVLGEILGGQIMPKGATESTEASKPIVAGLVPCYKSPDPRMQAAFIEMQKASREHCVFYVGPPWASSVVHWTRNCLIAELIKTQKPWTHVLFIDDDIVPSPDALIKLLSHKKDIVAGICTRRTDPPIPNIRYFEEGTGTYREIWSWPANKLIEVGAVGTGMMLISRDALNKVADAYWKCLYEREVYQLSEERALWLQEARLKHFDESANAYWFRFLTNLDGSFEMGEDVSFCFMATRYCGLKIYVDTSVQPGHVGQYEYGIKDFLPYRDAMIEKAKMDGKYRDESQLKASEPSQMNSFKLTYQAEEPVTA